MCVCVCVVWFLSTACPLAYLSDVTTLVSIYLWAGSHSDHIATFGIIMFLLDTQLTAGAIFFRDSTSFPLSVWLALLPTPEMSDLGCFVYYSRFSVLSLWGASLILIHFPFTALWTTVTASRQIFDLIWLISPLFQYVSCPVLCLCARATSWARKALHFSVLLVKFNACLLNIWSH